MPIRPIAIGLVLASTCAFSAFAQQSFTDAQETEIKGLVREYILENPEIIMEAVQALQARDAQAKLDRQRDALAALGNGLEPDSDDMVLGNPDGDVTVVEFFDYNCGYCKSMFPNLMAAVEADGNTRLVVKEYPILGEGSVIASRAALAARKQGKYQEFHTALLNFKGRLGDTAIDAVAASVGLDLRQLRSDMASKEVDAVIDRTNDVAKQLEITGTPAFVIGDLILPGAIPQSEMTRLIAAAREADQS